MEKILKMLVIGLPSAALLCCALPSAFAAEQKDAQIYTIGLDALGGTSSVGRYRQPERQAQRSARPAHTGRLHL